MTLFSFEHGKLENIFIVTCKYNIIPKYILMFVCIIVCSESPFSKNSFNIRNQFVIFYTIIFYNFYTALQRKLID